MTVEKIQSATTGLERLLACTQYKHLSSKVVSVCEASLGCNYHGSMILQRLKGGMSIVHARSCQERHGAIHSALGAVGHVMLASPIWM